MLRSEAEQMVRRVAEETGVQFTEEQISALALIVLRIAGRMLEEAISSSQSSRPGSKPGFFT